MRPFSVGQTMNSAGYLGGGGARPAAEVWTGVRAALKRELDQAAFESYVAPAILHERADGALFLATRTVTARDWLRREAWKRLVQLWVEQDASGRELFLKSAGELEEGLSPAAVAAFEAAAQPKGAPRATRPADRPSGLREDYRFETFVAGPSNEFAHDVARKIGDWDEGRFNPVVFHGPYGFGKTHLLNAVAWAASEIRPEAKVIYLTAERFLNTFVQAVRGGGAAAFKDEVRTADLLLIDDVQFVGGKASTQEELIHTLAALMGEGRRVILSADRPPQEMTEIDPRLRSMLTAGLVCGIEAADRDLRLGVLERKLAELGRSGPARPVLEFLADRFIASVRELEGALNILVYRAGHRLGEVTVEEAQALLRPHLKVGDRRVTVDEIQKATAEHFGLTKTELLSERRVRSVARPRQVSMWLCKQLTSRSYPDIARRSGGRDHTTVLHAVRRIEELIKTDPNLAADVEALMRKIKG